MVLSDAEARLARTARRKRYFLRRVAVPSTGFHWGDAGIGGAATATVLGVLGSAVAFRRRVSTAH